jgi:hypothetical protein
MLPDGAGVVYPARAGNRPAARSMPMLALSMLVWRDAGWLEPQFVQMSDLPLS